MIEAVGAGVTHLKAGDRAAYCSGPPGSYSLARVMPAKTRRQAARRDLVRDRRGDDAEGPDGAVPAQAHARRRRRCEPGDFIVWHAAAGGVGLIACQWAQGARPEADRHGRQRREVRARARQRRRLHDQLPHRGLRRAGQGDHRRQGREGRLRLGRQGHLGQVARLPAPVRPDGELRQRLGRRAAVRAGLARRRRARST